MVQVSLARPLWSAGTARAPLAWHIKQSVRPSKVCGIAVGGGVGVDVGGGVGVGVGVGVGAGVGVGVGAGVGVGVGSGVVGGGGGVGVVGVIAGAGVGSAELGVDVSSPPQAVNAAIDTISVSANIINNTLFFIDLPPQVFRFPGHLFSHPSPIVFKVSFMLIP